jgi:ribonuclease HI
VFRNFEGDFLFGFAKPLGNLSPFQVELCGAMKAIELAYRFNWKNIWIETDSSLVVSAFTTRSECVPWFLRNRWHNSLLLLNGLNCFITHIHREGNMVADLLASHGLSLPYFTHWLVAPDFIESCLFKNHLGIPNFRFYVS